MYRPTLLCIALLSLGCSATGVIIKPPLVSRCDTAGLRNCDDLADGIVAWVDGDKEDARTKIKKAVAENAPSKLKQFSASIRMMGEIPGLAEHMEPLLEIARLLEPQDATDATPAAVAHDDDDEEDAPDSGSTTAASGMRATTLTADTDPAQLESGVAVVASGDRDRCDGERGGAGFCVRVATGPFVLTDLGVGVSCPYDVIAVAGARNSAPGWLIAGLGARMPGAHGMRILVREGEMVRVGVIAKSDALLRADSRCNVAWAGFRPYSPESADAAAQDDADDASDGASGDKSGKTKKKHAKKSDRKKSTEKKTDHKSSTKKPAKHGK